MEQSEQKIFLTKFGEESLALLLAANCSNGIEIAVELGFMIADYDGDI